MFGRLVRVTGTVLVIAVAFVTPVLATSVPASADTVVDGCTIVSNPTLSNFTTCPNTNFTGADLLGVNLDYANLAGSTFNNSLLAQCAFSLTTSPPVSCSNATFENATLSRATFTGATTTSCVTVQGTPTLTNTTCAGVDLTSANLQSAGLAGLDLTAVTLSSADLVGANISGANFLATFSIGSSGLFQYFGPNMSGANLTGLDLSGLNLSVTNLTGANLTGAQLQNVTVNSITEDATTFGGQLGQANLTDANLTGDNLSGATLTGANFSGTVLVPSNQTVLATSGAGAVATWPTPPSLPGATPGSCTPSSGSTFPLGTTTVTCQVLDSNGDVATGTFTVEVTLVVNGCTIVSNPTPTNFTNCPNTGFAGADLTGVNLSYANLAGSTFAGCTFLPPISCTSATLNGATLTQANLSGASFVSCGGTLTGTGIFCGGASLTNATLIQANLSSATFFLMQEGFASNFPGVDLSGANLSGADLAQANVTTMVNFSNANLSGANLTGTSFGDNLTNADLTGANLTNASMEGTVVTITVPATLTGAILTGTLLVPSNQTVTATSPAGAVVTWSTPAPIPGATPGTCTPASGSTFPLGTTTVTCQVLDASGDVATGTFTVSVVPPPTTFVGVPSNGATVSGDIWLDAGAQSPVGVASVTFELSGGAITNQVISGSTPTIYGYLGAWNSTSVPNGTYTLQSVATDVDGVSTTSAPVTISVNNPPPSTSVVIPSDGATQSGTTALLDASSTADVTSVSYELSGGTLTNQSIATGTPSLYGWLAEWNTTSVPNGTYTLQSVGTTSGGTVTSTPITITVSN